MMRSLPGGLVARLRGRGADLLAAASLGVYLFENRRVHPQVDDAFITYRYALNLIEGNGLVYNVGERVEGITSLAWTLLVAAGAAIGIDPTLASHGLGVASGLAALWLTYVYARSGLTQGESIWAAFAPWLLLCTTGFAWWTTSGLESGAFLAAAAGALVAVDRGHPRTAMAIAVLATLVRPEGALLAAVLLLFLLLTRAVTLKRAVGLGAVYAAFVLALTAFRLVYYGAPLPNTFYAKVGGTELWGVYYLVSFVLQLLVPTIVPSLYAIRDRRMALGLAWLATVTCYVAAVGGDVFQHARFFLPILPVLFALVVRGALRASTQAAFGARVAVLSVPLCFVWYVAGPIGGALAIPLVVLLAAARAVPQRWAGAGILASALGLAVVADRLNALLYPWPFVKAAIAGSRGSEVEFTRTATGHLHRFAEARARKLNRRIRRNRSEDLVASPAIGVLGYVCRTPILDLVGLVDPVVARSPSSGVHDGSFRAPGHQRSNVDYVLTRKPKFVVIPREGETPFPLPSILALWRSPSFQRHYVWDADLMAYVRKPPKKPRKRPTAVSDPFQR